MEQTSGSEGQWIADALERYLNKERWEQWVGTVASTVPDHFEAYARILHRVNGNHPREIRWADVAASKGTVIHPEVQFHSMARAGLYQSVLLDGTDQGSPSHGELDNTQWAALVPILQGGTATPGSMYLAVWNGWDGFEPGISEGVPAGKGEDLVVAGGLRKYFVFHGTGSEFARPPWFDAGLGLNTQTPNLAWPQDRAWCLATEIDFDSTLVGGTAELIAAVVHSHVLEAVEVTPETHLTSEADVVNRPHS